MSSSSNSIGSSAHSYKNCNETINILVNGVKEARALKEGGNLPAALESLKKLASDFQSALPATNQAFKDWTAKEIHGLTDARGDPVSNADVRKRLRESILSFARTANDVVRAVQNQNLRTPVAMGCLASIEVDLTTTLGKVGSFAKSLDSSEILPVFEQVLYTAARVPGMLNSNSAQTHVTASPQPSFETSYGVPEAQEYVESIVGKKKLLQLEDLQIFQERILPIFEENQSLLGAEWVEWFRDVVENFSAHEAKNNESYENILERLRKLNTPKMSRKKRVSFDEAHTPSHTLHRASRDRHPAALSVKPAKEAFSKTLDDIQQELDLISSEEEKAEYLKTDFFKKVKDNPGIILVIMRKNPVWLTSLDEGSLLEISQLARLNESTKIALICFRKIILTKSMDPVKEIHGINNKEIKDRALKQLTIMLKKAKALYGLREAQTYVERVVANNGLLKLEDLQIFQDGILMIFEENQSLLEADWLEWFKGVLENHTAENAKRNKTYIKILKELDQLNATIASALICFGKIIETNSIDPIKEIYNINDKKIKANALKRLKNMLKKAGTSYGLSNAQGYVERIVDQIRETGRRLQPEDLQIFQDGILPIFKENQSLLKSEWLEWFRDVLENHSTDDARRTEYYINILKELDQLTPR